MNSDSDCRRDCDPIVPPKRSPELLLNLRSTVGADGEAALFDVTLSNKGRFDVFIPFCAMPDLFTEIRHASALMIQRQRLRLDRGKDTMLEMWETALRPARVECLVDPRYGDRLFLFQFDTHCPIGMRFSPLELVHVRHLLSLRMNH